MALYKFISEKVKFGNLFNQNISLFISTVYLLLKAFKKKPDNKELDNYSGKNEQLKNDFAAHLNRKISKILKNRLDENDINFINSISEDLTNRIRIIELKSGNHPRLTEKTKWEKYGQWRHPEQYWQNYLNRYFEIFEPIKSLLNPKLNLILDQLIMYKFQNSEETYLIQKKELKKNPPIEPNVLYSDSTLLFVHKVEIPIKDTTIEVNVTIEVEDISIVEEILDRIIENNPHWKMDLLTIEQLEENIKDVLNNHFESVSFVTYSSEFPE
ncbi:MAG: hypothetical protein ACK41Z_04280 [Sediminibacterium sp.]